MSSKSLSSPEQHQQPPTKELTLHFAPQTVKVQMTEAQYRELKDCIYPETRGRLVSSILSSSSSSSSSMGDGLPGRLLPISSTDHLREKTQGVFSSSVCPPYIENVKIDFPALLEANNRRSQKTLASSSGDQYSSDHNEAMTKTEGATSHHHQSHRPALMSPPDNKDSYDDKTATINHYGQTAKVVESSSSIDSNHQSKIKTQNNHTILFSYNESDISDDETKLKNGECFKKLWLQKLQKELESSAGERKVDVMFSFEADNEDDSVESNKKKSNSFLHHWKILPPSKLQTLLSSSAPVSDNETKTSLLQFTCASEHLVTDFENKETKNTIDSVLVNEKFGSIERYTTIGNHSGPAAWNGLWRKIIDCIPPPPEPGFFSRVSSGLFSGSSSSKPPQQQQRAPEPPQHYHQSSSSYNSQNNTNRNSTTSHHSTTSSYSSKPTNSSTGHQHQTASNYYGDVTTTASSSSANNNSVTKVTVMLLNYDDSLILPKGSSSSSSGKIKEEWVDIFKKEITSRVQSASRNRGGGSSQISLDFKSTSASSCPSSDTKTVCWHLTQGRADRYALPSLSDPSKVKYLILGMSVRSYEEYDSFSINDYETGPETVVRDVYNPSEAMKRIVDRILAAV